MVPISRVYGGGGSGFYRKSQEGVSQERPGGQEGVHGEFGGGGG